MTLNEHIKELERKQKEAIGVVGKAMKVAVFATHSNVVSRIFDDGKASDESKIGAYNDSNPIYVNPKISPKAFPTKGKNGANNKTGYFESYKDYKQSIGQPTSYVDLQLFGTMRRDFANSVQRIDEVTFAEGFSDEKNVLKMQGNESRFSKTIFQHTDQENQFYLETFNDEFINGTERNRQD